MCSFSRVDGRPLALSCLFSCFVSFPNLIAVHESCSVHSCQIRAETRSLATTLAFARRCCSPQVFQPFGIDVSVAESLLFKSVFWLSRASFIVQIHLASRSSSAVLFRQQFCPVRQSSEACLSFKPAAGKVYGLNTQNGHIFWSRQLVDPSAVSPL